MQNLLDQQQRLALQDKKLLEEYQSEIKDLKSLKNPVKSIENKDINDKSDIAKKPNKIKKWWHIRK